MSERLFETFDALGEALVEAGIGRIVMREICEIRPWPGEGHRVTVGLVHRATFLAYHQGTVWQCHVTGDQLAECQTWLLNRGIHIKKVSGNIA